MYFISIQVALVSLSPHAGWQSLPSQRDCQIAITDEDDFDAFGQAVDSIADLNGDGVREILVGDYARTIQGEMLGSVSVMSGKSGQILSEVFGSPDSGCFGAQIASVGDTNGDAFPDFIVAAPCRDPHLSRDGRYVGVYSGHDCHERLRVLPSATDQEFADHIAPLNDVDGDACADFVLSFAASPLGLPSVTASRDVAWEDLVNGVRVHSGKTGAMIFERRLLCSYPAFITSVCTRTDWDHDGIKDIAVSIGATGMKMHHGTVFVLSGRDGHTINVIEAGAGCGARPFGTAFVSVRDMNGDDVGDMVVACPSYEPTSKVFMLSGKDGQLIRTVERNVHNLGESICVLGDVDGDGVDEIALGAPERESAKLWLSDGSVYVLSGREDVELARFNWLADASCRASSLSGAADCDGDGISDLVIGSSADSLTETCGSVIVVSGRTGSMLLYMVASHTSP